MKKIFACALALTITASMSGCGNSNDSSASGKTADSKAETAVAEENSKADETDSSKNASKEDESDIETEPEPDVNVKAMLENYETASVLFEMDTDISSLFLDPDEEVMSNLIESRESVLDGEAYVKPDFSIEEVGGLPMVKISTDKTYEYQYEAPSEETGAIEHTAAKGKSIMLFEIDKEKLLGGQNGDITLEFLVKKKTGAGDSGGGQVYIGDYTDHITYDWGSILSVYQNPVETENGYGTSVLKGYFGVMYIDSFSDEYDVYLADIKVTKNGFTVVYPDYKCGERAEENTDTRTPSQQLRFYDNASVYFKNDTDVSSLFEDSYKDDISIAEIDGIPMVKVYPGPSHFESSADYVYWQLPLIKLFAGAEDRLSDVSEIQLDVIYINNEDGTLREWFNGYELIGEYDYIGVFSDSYESDGEGGYYYYNEEHIRGLGDEYDALSSDAVLVFSKNFEDSSMYIADIQFLDKDGNVIVCPNFTK